MIAQAANIEKKILDIKYGRVLEGLKIGIPDIDEYIRFKAGNFNLLIGHANVGKTTIITYLLYGVGNEAQFKVSCSGLVKTLLQA